MPIPGHVLASQLQPFEFTDFVRIIPSKHSSTPLGCMPGNSRFGSATNSFAVLYAARDLATALAETLIRDRFEGLTDRKLFASEILDRSAVALETTRVLSLIDLRGGGCLKLGISTEITGAKLFDHAQSFSDNAYSNRSIDGILYPSRLTSKTCVAIFDRVIASSLKAHDCVPLSRISKVGSSLSELNIQLIR